MQVKTQRLPTLVCHLLLVVALVTGCARARRGEFYARPPAPLPLGNTCDAIWGKQVTNAEASKFVVYEHEFHPHTLRLNPAGEDHVKEIAARITGGETHPVVVERSFTSQNADKNEQIPVHANPELDMQRRAVIVKSLAALGIGNAEGRVVVAPAFAEGLRAGAAENAYTRGVGTSSSSSFGGGFGGFGGGGGLGVF